MGSKRCRSRNRWRWKLGHRLSNRLTYGGEINGSASLQISSGPSRGSGVVVLTAANTYTAIYNPAGSLNVLSGSYASGGNDRLIFNGGASSNMLDFTNLGASNSQLEIPGLTGGLAWDMSRWTSHGIIAIYSPIPEPSRSIVLVSGWAMILQLRRRAAIAG